MKSRNKSISHLVVRQSFLILD